ncbi:hypothetical protein [Streptomyces sp. NPDC058677]
MAVTVTDERRTELWHRAERIRVGVDTVRAARAALAQERAGHAESTGQ